MKTIIDYLEMNEKKTPNKVLFVDKDDTITYHNFINLTKKIASNFKNLNNKPIALFMDKSIPLLASMFGVLYSGNFYSIIDTKMPKERIDKLLSTLNPSLIITDNKNKNKISGNILIYEELTDESYENININQNNPMYVLFTSGSTGMPKGVVISHKACLAYIKWFVPCFGINSATIFGSSTPLYFSMSISDLFGTIYAGSTFVLIPKMYFSFPTKLIDYLYEKKINTTYWVPSAYQILANYKVLDKDKLIYLKKLLFAGEVMNSKVLKEWAKNTNLDLIANLFGPTETTDICTYYKLDKIPNDIPIGHICEGLHAYILDKDLKEVKEGELYVGGPFLADGYYNNPEKTKENFIKNPFKENDILYKTGDLVKYNRNNELIYKGRRDYQIKHLGYRIELGEIETNVNNLDLIINCACIYNNNHIYLYYEGLMTKEDLLKELVNLLPSYMIPENIIKVDKINYNSNGKIDRVYYKELTKER